MPIDETMSSPVYVRLRGPGADPFDLAPGSMLGRSPTASLCVDDPRVSEAHALVSLRRGQLYLLALRRRFYVGGRALSEARLRRGLVFELVPGLEYRVEAVARPKRITALEAKTLGTRALSGVMTIEGGDPPRVLGRYERDGAAHVWAVGERWRLRRRGEEAVDLALDEPFEVEGLELRLRSLPIETLGCSTTRGETEGEAALHIKASYDTVELRMDGHPISHVNGVCGRVLAELVSFGDPVSWQLVAGEVWPGDEVSGPDLRHRWDVTLGRLRKKVREAGVRRDLVRTDGSGQVWLVLFDGDTAIDRS